MVEGYLRPTVASGFDTLATSSPQWPKRVEPPIPFVVVYEDLVQAYEGAAREIPGFLNVPISHDLALGKRKLLSQADSLTETWIEEYLERKRTGWEESTARYPRGRSKDQGDTIT